MIVTMLYFARSKLLFLKRFFFLISLIRVINAHSEWPYLHSCWSDRWYGMLMFRLQPKSIYQITTRIYYIFLESDLIAFFLLLHFHFCSLWVYYWQFLVFYIRHVRLFLRKRSIDHFKTSNLNSLMCWFARPKKKNQIHTIMEYLNCQNYQVVTHVQLFEHCWQIVALHWMFIQKFSRHFRAIRLSKWSILNKSSIVIIIFVCVCVWIWCQFI